jgi:hypothetical protein
VYEALLFLHVLAAFALVAAIVIYSAVVLGAPATRPVLSVANILWDAGGGLVLVFGVWLVLDLSAYELWDGWIIAAIVLWGIATELGRRARAGVVEGEAGAATISAAAARLHWLRTAATLALLIVMIYKPGA